MDEPLHALNPKRTHVAMAMSLPDEWVVEIEYKDRLGQTTKRTISPLKWIRKDHFLALCAGREEPRQFYLDRCVTVKLRPSCDLLMPEPVQSGVRRLPG